LFSFGAVLYEMAMGRMAFSGNTAAVVHEAILNRAPTSLVRVNPEISPELERIINKALEKDRKLRYQSAADIRTDLQRLKRDAESGRAAVAAAETGLKAAPKSTWFRWAAVTGATVLVIGLAVGGWLFFSRKAHALTDKDTRGYLINHSKASWGLQMTELRLKLPYGPHRRPMGGFATFTSPESNAEARATLARCPRRVQRDSLGAAHRRSLA
jgi:hypothetical protein